MLIDFFSYPEELEPKENAWYENASNSLYFIEEPRVDKVTNKVTVTMSKKEKDSEGNILGVSAIDVDFKKFSHFLERLPNWKKWICFGYQ